MIYFLTDWFSKNTNIEADVVFNINKTFHEAGLGTKVINTHLATYPNYFTKQFEFYDSDHFIQLMDLVADYFVSECVPTTLDDLDIPTDWEKTFTRTSVLLSKNGVTEAEVFFNTFGFVDQVHYYTEFGKEIDTYSEKGYVLYETLIDHQGKEYEKRVFDSRGQLILADFGNRVIINGAYHKRFQKLEYGSFKEIATELINNALKDFDPKEDSIIINGMSDTLVDIVKDFKFPESVVFVFAGPIQDCISQIDSYFDVFEKGERIVTDNVQLQEILNGKPKYKLIGKMTDVLPLYPTNLSLGESNTYSENIIHWQIDQFNSETKNVLTELLKTKLDVPELSLVVESNKKSDEQEVLGVLAEFVTKTFGVSLNTSEYELVKKYYEASEKEEMTPGLRELFQKTKQLNPEFEKVISAYLFYASVTFKNNLSIQELKDDLQSVRIFIDQRDKYLFLSHSIALSTGIPILSKNRSPYLLNGKNGFIFNNNKQLIEEVKSYLVDTDQWNQSLVESVELIEKNRASELLKTWRESLK